MKKLFNGIFANKKVLITGDTGFKGSWLAIWLKELGADIYGYALPPKTASDNFVQCKLENLITHGNPFRNFMCFFFLAENNSAYGLC